MQALQDYTAAVTTYLVALLTMSGAFLSDNSGSIIQLLGLVLLLARLIQEVPRAAKVVYSTFKRTVTKTSTGTVTTTVETAVKRSG